MTSDPVAGRRRGRTGRGWDAAPPRAPRKRGSTSGGGRAAAAGSSADYPDGADSGEAGFAGRAGSGDPGALDPGGPGGLGAPDPAERAREICLRQLAVRPRTRAELATTLRRNGFAEPVINEVLDRYSEVGMIDDAAFANAWVTSRHHSKGLARRALGAELRRRGVAPETVGEALTQLGGDTEAQTARELVERRLRSVRGGDPQTLLRRLVGMLARKGYPPGLAFRVVKEALAADERTAEIAEQLDPDALADAAGEDSAGTG